MKIFNLAIIILLLLFGFASCDKESSQEKSKEEFCLYLNSDNMDKTIPIINDYLAELKSDLDEIQKMQAFTEWLKSCPCIIDATILCVSCIYTLPAQSEISMIFKENGTTVEVILDISMSNPLKAGICAINYGEQDNKDEPKFVRIEDLSFENYPKVDGSTSTRALNMMVACKLLDVSYSWQMITGNAAVTPMYYEWVVSPNVENVPNKYREDFFEKRVITSQTHGAFMNLINGKADIILTHRTVSLDEKKYADALGVTLTETSIALDAFVFVVSPTNTVKSLDVSQVQKIYTGEITNWLEVGGKNEPINVYTRPRNSGSEEVFRTLVMNDLEPANFPEVSEIGGMSMVFSEVRYGGNGICYTFNNYKDMIVRVPDSEVPKIAINGIFPDDETVENRTYPFISEVHVAIRSNLDRNSMAYKLYEWLQSENAKSTIAECGFIPK
jgi:ABC-type phosphate transport system, periplasmic component